MIYRTKPRAKQWQSSYSNYQVIAQIFTHYDPIVNYNEMQLERQQYPQIVEQLKSREAQMNKTVTINVISSQIVKKFMWNFLLQLSNIHH